jgi:hypothetical protein
MTISVGEMGMQEPWLRLNTVSLGHWLRKSKMASNGDPAFRLARHCDVRNGMKTTVFWREIAATEIALNKTPAEKLAKRPFVNGR